MANFDRFLERIGFKRPGPGTNSSETPTPLPDSDGSISEGGNLAAFRTITTMLAEIERGTPVEIGDNLPGLKDSDERQQLKLSNAFSHLAVGQHEVVAVTTRIVDKALNVLITKNHERDDNDIFPATAHLEITSPSEPSDLQGRSAFEYMKTFTSNSDKYW